MPAAQRNGDLNSAGAAVTSSRNVKVNSKSITVNGDAVAYNGGNKEKIQPKHLENRQRLVSEGKVDMQGLEITKPALVQKPIVEEPVVEEVSAPVKKKKTTKKKKAK